MSLREMVQVGLMNFKYMERFRFPRWAMGLIFLLGIILLFILNQPELAFVLFFLGIVFIIERIWPEEWDAEKRNNVINSLDK